jgi:hypothetical protein
MKAIVTKGFEGLPDGELIVRTFKPGDEVHGELAAVALREGWAEDEDAPAPEPTPVSSQRPDRKRRRSEAEGDGGEQ